MTLRWGRSGPERDAGVHQHQYVRLAELMQPREPEPPNPLDQVVADLVRRYDPGGYRLQCPVSGCGKGWTIPRMELDPEPIDVDPSGFGDYVVRAEGVPREDVEAILRAHVELHAALLETDVRTAPTPWPPDWDQQEWCDGATCEHTRCLDGTNHWLEP